MPERPDLQAARQIAERYGMAPILELLDYIDVLETTGRALLANLDSEPVWEMERGPDDKLVEAFRGALDG